MATIVKKDQAPTGAIQRVRVTMTSRNPKTIEKVMSDVFSRAKEEKVTVHGPVRLPTRTLKITTRKTPCGNGSNTWDTFELKIYKRLIDIEAQTDVVKKITSIQIESGVDVAITLPDQN